MTGNAIAAIATAAIAKKTLLFILVIVHLLRFV